MKIVKEYINEKFEQESDPIDDLGIGINIQQGDIFIPIKKSNYDRISNSKTFKMKDNNYTVAYAYININQFIGIVLDYKFENRELTIDFWGRGSIRSNSDEEFDNMITQAYNKLKHLKDINFKNVDNYETLIMTSNQWKEYFKVINRE